MTENGRESDRRVPGDLACAAIREVLSYEPHRSLADGVVEVARALGDGTIVDHQNPIYHNAFHAGRGERTA